MRTSPSSARPSVTDDRGHGRLLARRMSSGLRAGLRSSFTTWVWTMVVSTFACPRYSWICLISTPLSSRCVAKLCRRVCTETGLWIFAFREAASGGTPQTPARTPPARAWLTSLHLRSNRHAIDAESGSCVLATGCRLGALGILRLYLARRCLAPTTGDASASQLVPSQLTTGFSCVWRWNQFPSRERADSRKLMYEWRLNGSHNRLRMVANDTAL